MKEIGKYMDKGKEIPKHLLRRNKRKRSRSRNSNFDEDVKDEDMDRDLRGLDRKLSL